MKLVLCDVCGTLYSGNSTYDFVEFLCKKNNKIRTTIYSISIKLFRKIHFLCPRKIKYQLERKLVSGVFRDILVKTVLEWSSDFFYSQYGNRLSLEKLNTFGYKKDIHLRLLSASIEEPVQILAKYLKIGYHASILEKKNGKYTGKFYKDLFGKKATILNSLNINNYEEVIFITDNIEDTDVIEKMVMKYSVQFSLKIIPYQHRRYWDDYFAKMVNMGHKIKYEYIEF